MEVKERLYLTEAEHATNDTLKADILMSFLSFSCGSLKCNCFQKLVSINLKIKKKTERKREIQN